MNQQRDNVFKVDELKFPYLYKFPGQNSDEVILFVTREHKIMLYIRLAVIFLIAIILVIVGYAVTGALDSFIESASIAGINMFITAIAAFVIFIGSWWVKNQWKKSLAFVTNKRLTKIIYTPVFYRLWYRPLGFKKCCN